MPVYLVELAYHTEWKQDQSETVAITAIDLGDAERLCRLYCAEEMRVLNGIVSARRVAEISIAANQAKGIRDYATEAEATA